MTDLFRIINDIARDQTIESRKKIQMLICILVKSTKKRIEMKKEK